ncbi:BQ5605_C007g04774 [Microbotryum silenes-dioicae]|uniref:Coronin n=1 Tax=Microbotryum silenes-dioicae TaxID=796604 RepID=A0A2X0MC23_9BASI|nr:BQ5605_C007g04774 [Microbotryum silenes-dioicae]
MSRFVRASNYRHVYGSPAKREQTYENIKISASAWDTNLVSASAKYLAVNYQSGGGGAFLVVPLDATGKLPDLFPLCRAHSAPVLDTDWSPFNDSLVASAGEDGRVALTHVDEQILRDALAAEPIVNDLEPTVKFVGHGRKAGHVLWHPTAEGILASASTDVKVWDVEHQTAAYTSVNHSDMVQSIDWDHQGTVFATTCKDKKLRLFDPRAGPEAITTVDSHSGIKGSRVCWMGSLDRIVTTGFSRTSDRQLFVWDSRDLNKGPVKTINIDQSSGTIMPFWCEGNNVLFLAGKGDGNVRYYEWDNDDLFYLTEYSSPQPQRGMTFLPPRALNPAEHEIARAFKATGTMIEPISFIVPRKSDAFQSDLYPPARSNQAALSAKEWLDGRTSKPNLVDLQNGVERKGGLGEKKVYTATSSQVTSVKQAESVKVTRTIATPVTTAPVAAPIPVKAPERVVERAVTPPAPAHSAPAPTSVESKAIDETKTNGGAPISFSSPPTTNNNNNNNTSNKNDEEIQELKVENAKLRDELCERDTMIRELELKLERIKAAFN